MKKIGILILLCITMLTSCGEKKTLTLPFSVSDIASVELYKVSDGEITLTKAVTEERTVKGLYNVFCKMVIKSTDHFDDDNYVAFNFILSDGTNYVIIYYGHGVKNGTLKVSDQYYYFVSSDVRGIWEAYARETIETEE